MQNQQENALQTSFTCDNTPLAFDNGSLERFAALRDTHERLANVIRQQQNTVIAARSKVYRGFE